MEGNVETAFSGPRGKPGMKFLKNRKVWIGALVVLILGGSYLGYRTDVQSQVKAVRKFTRATQVLTMLARPGLPISLTAEQIRKAIPILEELQPKPQIDAAMATQATARLEKLLTPDQQKALAALNDSRAGQGQGQDFAALFGGSGAGTGTDGQSGQGGQRRQGSGGTAAGGSGAAGGGNWQGASGTGRPDAQTLRQLQRQAQNARTIAGSTLTRIIQTLWNRLDQMGASTGS